jgi:uncharacterized protein
MSFANIRKEKMMKTKLPSSIKSFEDLLVMFDYNRASSLNVEETGVEQKNGVSIHDLSYASPGHSRVKAYWVVPPGEGPFASLIFVHPGPGDRTNFLDEAVMLAQQGAASLLIEAPWAQAEAWSKTMGEPEHDRQEHLQTALDLRRAVDLITARPEVDANRLGYVGHSFGALFGGILAGVEKRIKAFILMAGVGSFSDVAAVNIPTLKGPALEEYSQVLARIDPIYYIGYAAPAALFFQLAQHDAFPREKLLAYTEAANQPKLIKWYDADHYSVNEVGRNDRKEWLRSQLALEQTP